MLEENAAQALATNLSAVALNVDAATGLGTAKTLQPEAQGMVLQESSQMNSLSFPSPPSVTAIPKRKLPVLDLLHWYESPSPIPRGVRFAERKERNNCTNAFREGPIQPLVSSEVGTRQPADLTWRISEQEPNRRPDSDSKRRELTGSRIFDHDTRNMEKSAIPQKRSTSLSEMIKRRELSGTLSGSEVDAHTRKKPNSAAKAKELEGSDIFGRSSQELLNGHLVSTGDNSQGFGMAQHKRQSCYRKAAELFGHDIFKADSATGINYEKMTNSAKRREMIGNNIFSAKFSVDNKHPKRVTKLPPGGKSDLKLY